MHLLLQSPWILGLGFAFWITGCSVVPADPTPDPVTSGKWMEGTQSVTDQSSQLIGYHRWGIPQFNEMLALAIKENRNLMRSRSNLDEAVARRKIARAALFPQASAEGSAARQRSSETAGIAENLPPEVFEPLQNFYVSGLNASWELDLFGFNRNQVKGATARLEATAAQLEAVRLSIEAEVALAYVEWAALAESLALTEERRQLQSETSSLVSIRVKAGLADTLADRSARRDLRLAEAELPRIRASMAAACYRLAVLTGLSPEAFCAHFTQPKKLPGKAADRLPASLPATVLRRRPDVAAAERGLAAALAELGVAEAEFYPRLRLTGGVGWASGTVRDSFDGASSTWLIRPSIYLPIFEGGRLRAQRSAAQARLEAARATYEQAVLVALSDVETILSAHLAAKQQASSLSAAAADARAAEARAATLYHGGLSDLETLLTARRLRSQTESLLLAAHAEILSQAIRYEKAIGGNRPG